MKGCQSVDEEEGKDGRVWTGERERMAECVWGRGKGAVAVAEGKDGRARAGK